MDTHTENHLAEAAAERARLYEEGMIGGLIGAVAIALWFFVLDAYHGRPFFTPSILGSALLHAKVQGAPISVQAVVTFTWIHTMVFAAIGVAAARLIRLAERDPNYGFGILLLFVVFEFGFIAASMVLAEGLVDELTLPAILVGNLLAAGAMAAYFRSRHPDLKLLP